MLTGKYLTFAEEFFFPSSSGSFDYIKMRVFYTQWQSYPLFVHKVGLNVKSQLIVKTHIGITET